LSSDPDQQPQAGERNELKRKRVRRRSRPEQVFAAIQRPRWEVWGIVLLVLAVCFFGGGRSLAVKSSAMILIGIWGIMLPPGYRLPKVVLISLAAAIGAPLLAFLPASWLGSEISWRSTLTENWGINLSSFSTSQPWMTLETWIEYTVALFWLVWCGSRGSTTSDRRLAIRILSLGISAIAILTLLVEAKILHIAWWTFPSELGNTIGPFANRNHTSSLMTLGSLLSAAASYDAFRRKERVGILFLLSLVPLGMVILHNTSRAALILYFVGLSLWLWTASVKGGLLRKISLTGSLALAGVAGLFLFGGKILSRFAKPDGSGIQFSSFSTRTQLFEDSVSIASDSPWIGIGFGNFKDVFPQLSTTHGPMYCFLHPESDWLWLLTEGGITTFCTFAALVGLLALMTGPWFINKDAESSSDSRQDRRLRNAFAIAVFLAALHGLVDVPNHTPGYGLLSALLLGLALRSAEVSIPSSGMTRAGNRIVGLGIVVLGCLQLCTAFGKPVLRGSSSARVLAGRSLELANSDRDQDAFDAMEKAISMNPLNWSLYFQRAQIHLRLNHAENEAYLDFGRARALEPNLVKPCVEEGVIWKDRRPELAIAAWGEALRREPVHSNSLYHTLFMEGARSRALLPGLIQLAKTPEQKLTILSYPSLYEDHSPGTFQWMLEEFLTQKTNVESLDSKDRNTLFQVWSQHGDRLALIKGLEANSNWHLDGWQILCNEYARDGKYEEAFKMAKRYELPPTSPSITGLMPVNQLEQNFLFNPTDARRGIDLYFGYKSRGEWTQALATLEKVAALPTAPNYLSYEMASIYAEKEDFRRAWELMLQYLSRPK
jgi:O-antigen ligase/Flp pilus assembly protein TadD